MQGFTIAETGLFYIWRCLLAYNGLCFYIILYIILLVFIAAKGSKEEKRSFLYPAAIMLLTVYNPIFPLIINRFFDVNKEYYRLFWIAPIVLLPSYMAAKETGAGRRSRGAKCIMFVACTLIFVGMGTFVYKGGYPMQENIYKVPNEVLEVADIIHRSASVKYPTSICDYNLHMELRQYDASILLAADRTQYLEAITDTFQDEQTQQENYYVNKLLAVVARGVSIPKEEFLESLDATNTEFVVLHSVSHMVPYLKRAGLTEVGRAGSRTVFHYDLKNPIDYDLVDYSSFE